MCLAVPGKVISIEDNGISRLAKVQFGGIIRSASLDLVPEASVDDYVLVHVGYALSRIDEAEAKRTLRDLQVLSDLQQEFASDEEPINSRTVEPAR